MSLSFVQSGFSNPNFDDDIDNFLSDLGLEQECCELRYNDTGLPVLCHICQQSNKWILEGRTYVCEHEEIRLKYFLPCRVISDVSITKVYEV